MIDFVVAQADSQLRGVQESQSLDSAILAEQFYFYTVVLMKPTWISHMTTTV